MTKVRESSMIDKDKVWEKGTIVTGYNHKEYRKDACGAWIKYSDYCNRTSSFGWEIDHIKPLSMLGGYLNDKKDHIDNLRPLNWLNKLSKGDDYPNYKSAICSDGDKNVFESKRMTINSKRIDEANDIFREH